MKDKTIGRILGFFLVISAILAVVAIDSVRNINRSIASSDWVNHTHDVIQRINEIPADLHAADGAAVTSVVTRDPRNKAACRAALADLAEHLEDAKALTRHEPSQHEQILQLEAMANDRAEWDRGILNADKPESLRPLLGPDAGVGAMRQIEHAAEKLHNDEIALLEARDRISFRQARTTQWTVWAGVAIDLLLLGGVAWLICDDIRARRIATAALQKANEQLEAKVQERTAELAAANRQLRTDNIERTWANQALEHQLRYNQLIINSIADLVFVLTKAMNISRINPAVLRLTGLEPQELMNKPLSSVVQLAKEDGKAGGPLADLMARALTDGHDLRDLPAVIEDKRGRKTLVRLALFPLRDQDKVVGGVAVVQLSAEISPPESR